MEKKKRQQPDVPEISDSLRLNPEKRVCPAFDDVTIAKFTVGSPEKMGMRVPDNFCEEHIM